MSDWPTIDAAANAVMQQASNEHPANTVLMVTQNGYQLHDRVVRPSQVIVSKTE